ncbi:uncharacterized protein LY89DRAFT_158891 [Mollisia scopiformis]|uniref:Zn(2)-C6 fungal-type domain-containing protein n=1 Tax=Mollisia scopiformis TaxID=149040 RepID=A0A194WZW7_MOLSC|nr:uncharacterized protein LY89DRAFT_158891 [Mollisia scopiformis]KUJ13490.1 hypothetical protein LY89DRAFT_158891 [Mollisia scopiformis]
MDEPELSLRQKKLRKGTKNCIECRRRKIRCTYPRDSAICSPCLTRGSRCRSQHDRLFPDSDIETMSLRDRVARLESMLETVLQRLPNDNSQESREILSNENLSDAEDVSAKDITASWDHLDPRAPFVSILDDAELLSPAIGSNDCSKARTDHSYSTPGSSSTTKSTVFAVKSFDTNQVRQYEQKSKKVCERLRSSLPVYDEMISALKLNGSWWYHFHRKTHPSAKVKESLASYASHLYISTNPVDLGTLVIAYTRSMGQDHHLYSLVEHLVICDSTYSHTVQGLECLLLLAKAYTDIGQPRRSWSLTRQGLNVAQLMGLDRQTQLAERSAFVWHCLYHNDRFTSLLLGLPYGVNDAHFPHLTVSNTGDADFVPHLFTHKCASISGKILDRDLMVVKPSYATTIDLDEELSSIAATLPTEWWDVPNELSGTDTEIDHIRTRLQQHFYFFQLKTYLHLPFLINASKSDPYHHSKIVCIEAARQMLKIFLIYHTMVNGEKLFECKTADFIGFTAAAILLIGLSKLESGPSLVLSDNDSRVISSVKAIFWESERKGCCIASQCYKALALLSSANDPTMQEDVKIPIPYFGVVVRRQVEHNKSCPTNDQNQRNGQSSSRTTPSTELAVAPSSSLQPFVSTSSIPATYDYIKSMPSMVDDMSWEVDEFGNLPMLDPAQFLNTGIMDIDQDWMMFLNDNMS